MTGNVLLLGSDERLRHALEFLIPGARVKGAPAPADTEGLGIDVVVIAGPHAIADLNEVRVHPTLHATPVVLVAPGSSLNDLDLEAIDVWPIIDGGFGLLDELMEHITRLLARAAHPSSGRKTAALRTAS